MHMHLKQYNLSIRLRCDLYGQIFQFNSQIKWMHTDSQIITGITIDYFFTVCIMYFVMF